MDNLDREKIVRIWSLIICNRGESKYKKSLPKLYFFSGNKCKRSNPKNTIFGEYLNSDNSIKIWKGPHVGIENLTSTILHEYTHYLQFWPWYTRYNKMYGYKKNPYEIEAKNSESLAKSIVEMSFDDKWLELVQKDKYLLRTYKNFIKSKLIDIL